MGLNGSFHSTQITTKHDFNPRSATHDFSLWETPNGGVKQQLYGCVRLALSLKKVGCSARSTQIAFFSSENVGCLIFEEKGDFVKLRCYVQFFWAISGTNFSLASLGFISPKKLCGRNFPPLCRVKEHNRNFAVHSSLAKLVRRSPKFAPFYTPF